MQGFNCVVVYDETAQHILLCLRKHEPYLGLYSFPGGKIEPGETGFDAAYRELHEETSITRDDISLVRLMEFRYDLSGVYVEIYVGRLRHAVAVAGDENELCWSTPDHDYFDPDIYAGEGFMGHVLMQVDFHRDICLKL